MKYNIFYYVRERECDMKNYCWALKNYLRENSIPFSSPDLSAPPLNSPSLIKIMSNAHFILAHAAVDPHSVALSRAVSDFSCWEWKVSWNYWVINFYDGNAFYSSSGWKSTAKIPLIHKWSITAFVWKKSRGKSQKKRDFFIAPLNSPSSSPWFYSTLNALQHISQNDVNGAILHWCKSPLGSKFKYIFNMQIQIAKSSFSTWELFLLLILFSLSLSVEGCRMSE